MIQETGSREKGTGNREQGTGKIKEKCSLSFMPHSELLNSCYIS
jgi:hypothetical protein